MNNMKKICQKAIIGWVALVMLAAVCLALNAKPAEADSQFTHRAFTILNPVKNGTYDVNKEMEIRVQRDAWVAAYVNGFLQNDYNHVYIDICKDGEVLERFEVQIYTSWYGPGTVAVLSFKPTQIGTYEMRIGFATADIDRKLLSEKEKITDETFVGSFKFNVAKRNPNPLTVVPVTKTLKASDLKKANKTFKAIKISKKEGPVTVKKIEEGSTASIYGKITVNEKNGQITLKKGNYKAGTYKLKLEVTAAGNKNYMPKTVTKTVKIVIK